jgi:hypothetical protein
MSYDRYIPGIYHLSYTCHIPGIYLSYETPLYTGYIPGIYLSHEIVRSARLQNFEFSIAMQQRTGIGSQGCLMFCRMWRQCHWASVSQPEGRAVARLGPRRQSRTAYIGGSAATDAHCSGGGAEPPPPQTPTWAAVVGSRGLRRRPLLRRRGRTSADDDEDDEAKVL